MATIFFLVDFHLGHVLPTLALAEALSSSGYTVRYTGLPCVERHIRRAGFDFTPIFAEVYGERSPAEDDPDPKVGNLFEAHLEPLIAGSLGKIWEEHAPDLMISGLFLSLEALILKYLYGTPLVMFSEYLREPMDSPVASARIRLGGVGSVGLGVLALAESQGRVVSSLEELVDPLEECRELIACPEEFELPGVRRAGRVSYLGPTLRPRDSLESLDPDLESWMDGRKVVFCSLGSDATTYSDALAIFQEILGAAEDLAEEGLSFLISTASEFLFRSLSTSAENVEIRAWTPQRRLLERTCLMITHGGLGSIKECIWDAVPMLVIPMSRDQPVNARRIVHHGIGQALSPKDCSRVAIKTSIQEILEDEALLVRLHEMQQRFRALAAESPGVAIIEQELAGCGNPQRAAKSQGAL